MGIIESRRSIRNFQEKKIPKEVLLRIVKAGMHAPNAYGKRSWEFLVLTEKENIIKAAKVNHNAAPRLMLRQLSYRFTVRARRER